MTQRVPHVLLYSHNGVGVGHFRRQLRLATELRRRRPETAILLVSGSYAASAMSGPLGFDVVSLPSIRMVDRYRNWEPRQTGMSIREVIRMRSDLLKRTVRRFRPDVLIADFMPAGPYGELLEALEELRAVGGRAVAGFRDIIDEPSFVRELWSSTGVYDVLREHYDAIFVYGAPEIMDFVADLGLDRELRDRVSYLGYLGPVTPRAPRPPESLPRGLACTGGGVDGGALLEMFIRALRPRASAFAELLVVGGPLLSETELRRLRALVDGSPITVARFASDLDHRLADSDVIVTMPGYNTTCELLSGTARAVVVPRSGPSLEQRLRADWLQGWGRADVIERQRLTADGVSAAIDRALLRPPPPRPPVAMDGLQRAGALLEAMAMGRDLPVGT